MPAHHSRLIFAGVIYWFCEAAVCCVPVFYAGELTFTHIKLLERTVCVCVCEQSGELMEEKSNVKLRCSGVSGCTDNFSKLLRNVLPKEGT